MRTCPTSKFNVTHFHWINFFINSKHLLVVTDSSLSTLFNITSHWNFWKTNPSSQNTARPSFISWSFLFVYNKWRGSRSQGPSHDGLALTWTHSKSAVKRPFEVEQHCAYWWQPLASTAPDEFTILYFCTEFNYWLWQQWQCLGYLGWLTVTLVFHETLLIWSWLMNACVELYVRL